MKLKNHFVFLLFFTISSFFWGMQACKEKENTPAPPSATEWWKKATVYQVFVRSFQDSQNDGKGDIRGLIQRLDYLNDGNPDTDNDLGIKALWLMPIFPSPSYHGYDVTDYLSINPDYGTMDDFQLLIQECKKRGIHVLLDFVLNHTSDRHPWFVESQKTDSSFRSWYIWNKEDPKWTQPWGNTSVWHPLGNEFYFGLFWKGMPDLNYKNQDVQNKMLEIALFWQKQGVSGFRIDAARYLVENGDKTGLYEQPETFAFWKNFRTQMKKLDPSFYLAGEIWTSVNNISKYCQGDQFDSAFQFPLSDAIFSSVSSMSSKPLRKALLELESIPLTCWANFLSNHDQERIFSKFNENNNMMKNAAFLLFTLPGTPFVYYGEEIGLSNGTIQGDQAKREPMKWDTSPQNGFTKGTPWTAMVPSRQSIVSVQIQDKNSLLHFYKKIIALRNQQETLSLGNISVIQQDSESILVFSRTYQGKTVWIVLNLEEKEATFSVDFPANHKVSVLLESSESTEWKHTIANQKLLGTLGKFGKVVLELQTLTP